MATRNRLTNSSDETDISTFLSGDVVFSIPFFQRSYCWKPERLKQLNQDILAILDGGEIHFLGAVIIHGRSSNPSDPKIYEVIDGQQRITTLFIYIAAAIKTLAEYGAFQEAAGLFLKYLMIPRDVNLHSNLKLQPCKEDRAQFNTIIGDLLKIIGLYERINSVKLKSLPSSGKETGILWNNYKSALRFFKSQYEKEGLNRVQDLYQAMLQSMSLVQIDVWDPTNGPKIFDSLNSRQEPMSVGDLVRNEIFSRVADEHPDFIEQIDQQYWRPFYNKFQENGENLFDSYFFPYGLLKNPNLKKSEVYSALRESWHNINDPNTIIEQLAIYQDAFLDIVNGSNKQQHTKPVAELFLHLKQSGLPTSTFPFFMRLSCAIKNSKISIIDAINTLAVIESFLVRSEVVPVVWTGITQG